MTGDRPPAPRRHPKQQRSQELVRAIQQACLEILETQGAEKLTTHRIAEVAGVHVGSLYQYFPNKDAVVAGVYNAMLAAEAETMVAISREVAEVAERSIEETLRRIIRLECDLHLRCLRLDAPFYRKYHRAIDAPALIDAKLAAHHQPSWAEWFPRLLGRHRSKLRLADLDTASFLATAALEGVLQAAVDRRPELLESEAFREDLLALLLRFLLGGDDAGGSNAAS